MGPWCTATFTRDMLHVRLFCINFVIFFSAALLSPYGTSDALLRSHPHMCGLYICAAILALLFSVSALLIFLILPLLSATRAVALLYVALLSALALGSYSVLFVSYGWFLFSVHLGLPLLAYVGGTVSSIVVLSFCFQLPVGSFIHWLHSDKDLTALEVLISKPVSVGSIITVVMYFLSLGVQSIASFAGLRSMMSPHAVIIITILSLQRRVPTLTHTDLPSSRPLQHVLRCQSHSESTCCE